jgi:hypothetical protein
MSDSWGGGLDPQTQAIIQYLLANGGAQPAPWQGAAGADVLGQLSFGFDPSMMQQQSLAGWIPPSQDAEDAGSLEEAGRQGNYLQDLMDLSADPMIAALMGGGSFSQDTFAPTVERELIARPATQQFNQWLTNAQAGDVSFEGIVAQAVQNGRSPRTAVSQMRQLIQQADANAESDNPDPDLQAQAEQIRSFLPPSFQYGAAGEPLTGDAAINWQSAFDDADDLVQAYQEEQQTQPGPIGATYDDEGNMTSSGGNIIVGPDGQFYRETTTESPLAEKYRELGIPLPTEQYEAGDILGAGWQQANQAYLDAEPQMDAAYRQLRTDRDMALSNATGNNLSQSDVFRMDTMDNDATRAVGAAPTQAEVAEAPQQAGGSWWDQQPEGSAAARLAGVGGAVGPAAAPIGDWFQDMWTGGPAAHDPAAGGTDLYGMPAENPVNNAISTGVNSFLEWLMTGKDRDPAAAAVIDPQTGLDAGGFQPPPPQNAEDMIPGSTQWLLAQTIGNQGNPNAAGHRQAPPTPGTPLPPLNTDDLAAIFDDGNAVAGVGGGGAGGVGGPRTLADLGEGDGTDYLDYWLNANGDQSYQQSRQGQPPLPPPSDANTLAMLRQMLTPTQVFENQRQAQFALPQTSNASPRTGPEPSESVRGTNVSGRTGPEPSELVSGSNVSGRTGPEPSEAATAPQGLSLMWPGGKQRQTPDQSSTNQMLRMLFGMDPEEPTGTSGPKDRAGNGKLRMGGGHRASAVDSYRLGQRANARTIDREIQRSNVSSWGRYRNTYGRDYWQARGYAEALQSLGVTPTSVALANRTGGVNALFGRG